MNIKDIKNKIEIPIQDGYCVYFLTDKSGEIIYVGQSNAQTLSRISLHRKTKDFDKAFIIKVKDKAAADRTEAEYIIKLKPRYNARLELRREMGLINKIDIKRETGLNMSLVKKIAAQNGIVCFTLGGQYWPEKLMDILKKYIADNPGKFKNRSRNSIKS